MNNLIGYKKMRVITYFLLIFLISFSVFFYINNFTQNLFAACQDDGATTTTTTKATTTTTKRQTTTTTKSGGCGSGGDDGGGSNGGGYIPGPGETGSSPNGGNGGPCAPPVECSKWVMCKYCDEQGKCTSVRECERCDRTTCINDSTCKSVMKQQTYNLCLNGICTQVSTNYADPSGFFLTDECSNVGGKCDIGCPRYLACSSTYRTFVDNQGQTQILTVYTCARSDFATHNECAKPSDCGPQSSSTEQSSTISCQVCNNKQQCVRQSFKASSCTKVKSQGYTLCTNNQDCRDASLPPTENGDSENGTNGNGGYYIPTCSINKFELPNHVWTGVNYEAKWSTNSDCKWGEITCKLGDEDCGDNETLSGEVTVGSIDHEKSFHITTPGVYTYQLKACYDKNNENTCVTWEDTLGTELDYIEVQAVNLPWWQEIIPVLPDKLQGFLRGLFLSFNK
ncbi:MAG: hypothetical protein PHG13_01740 [Candidatus Pacebacteria bacterium]|nr:hypothetical protein [Candidatus Paceibacterota bacterium]MDD5721842.1 hypothetical protein [Candidatus Paceibacterota bacterium]